MLKSLKKRSYRFVVVLLLLTTLLTFDVGRVTKVEALATTAAVVSSALLGVGVVYIAYQTLTGANVYLPSQQYVEEYLKSVGQEVVKTPSGSRLYDKIYSFAQRVGLVEDYTVNLTREQLLELYNDNKDIAAMQGITSFDLEFAPPTVPFDYTFDMTFASQTLYISSEQIYDSWYDVYTSNRYFIDVPAGPRVVAGVDPFSNVGRVFNSRLSEDVRNVRTSSGEYYVQELVDGQWRNVQNIYFAPYVISLSDPTDINKLTYYSQPDYWRNQGSSTGSYVTGYKRYPLLLDKPIYDEVTHELIPVGESDGNRQLSPLYPNNTDPNGNKYPIVPYVQLPSSNKWGFNLGDALTELINRGGQVITASWIGQLINQFLQSLSGTGDYNDFSEYNDNSITYYNNVSYYQDYDYYTYNYNIEDQEHIVPVDLNQIEKYTDNKYLDLVKEHAVDAGETFGEYVAFWHNVDPELVYVFLGSAIIVLIGAFIGKWGHS